MFQLPRNSHEQRKPLPNVHSLPFVSAFDRPCWPGSTLPRDLRGMVFASGKIGKCLKYFDPNTLRYVGGLECKTRLARLVQLPIPRGYSSDIFPGLDENSEVVISGSLDAPNDVVVFLLGSQRRGYRLHGGHDRFVLGIGVSPYGDWIVSGGRGEHRLNIWDAHSCTRMHQFADDDAPFSTSRVECFKEWSSNEVFVGGQTSENALAGCLYVYDVEKLIPLRLRKDAHEAWVNSICPDFRRNLFFTTGEDEVVRLWSRDFQLLQTVSLEASLGRGTSMYFSEKLNLLVVGTSSGGIEVFDPRYLSRIRMMDIHSAHVNDVMLLSGEVFLSGSDDETIKEFNVRTGKTITSDNLGGPVYGARAVHRWDEETSSAVEEAAELERIGFIETVAFSSGMLRIVANHVTIVLWNSLGVFVGGCG